MLSHFVVVFFLRFSATSAARGFFAAESAERRRKELGGETMGMLRELNRFGVVFFLRFSAPSAARDFFAAESAERRRKEFGGETMEMLREVDS